MKSRNVVIQILFILVVLFYGCTEDDGKKNENSLVTLSAISGVVLPVYDAIPVSTIAETAQYTGIVTWSPGDNPFAATTIYTATITLTAKSGFTMTGIPAGFFTVAGATSVSNSADSGTVTAVFPVTGSPSDINVAFQSVVQTGGASGTATTTALTLTFDIDPTALTVDDITVTGATKGALSGSGTTRTLSISNISVANGETVSVTISSPSGYAISGSPKTAIVYKNNPVTAVIFQSAVQAGGASGTATTTGLTLTFDVDPATLTADNITVTGAIKGTLSGSGTTRMLSISDISVANGETVSVAISSPSGYTISGSPKTAVVYKEAVSTSLGAGDIAFVGINSDGNDDFAFVLLKGITNGTILKISDKGWDDSTGFVDNIGEGELVWTASSDLAAGTVVHIKTTDNGSMSTNSFVASTGTLAPKAFPWDFTLSYTGDQLFIYTGTASSPTFIAGIHFNVEPGSTFANWDGGATDNKQSALPDQLTNGVSAIWVYFSGPEERDNFRYNGTLTSGTPAQLRAAINNIVNWDVDGSNITPYTLNPFPFTFTVN